MRFELFYPVKAFQLNQKFGNNPIVDGKPFYSKFRDMFGSPLKGHNGLDLNAYHGEPVYAPCDGMAYYSVDSYKGDGINILTNNKFDYGMGQAFFRVVLWHLCPADDPNFPIKIPSGSQVRTPVRTGDLLGYADNTGAPYESLGDHLHIGLYPENIGVDGGLKEIDPANGFSGSIDPLPFFCGQYAEDYAKLRDIQDEAVKVVSQTVEVIKNDTTDTPEQKVNWLQKILDFLRSIKWK